MATEPLTTTGARLRLLLRVVNGDESREEVLRQRLRAYLRSFDGRTSGGLRVVYDAGQAELADRDDGGTAPGLEEIRRHLEAVLRSGFPPEAGYPGVRGSRVQPLASLQFGTRRVEGPISKVNRRALGHVAGSYELWVDGGLRDVLLFTLLHLLTTSGAGIVARCPAPAEGDWSRKCGRWFLAAREGPGRPPEYCSPRCTGRERDKERHRADVLRQKAKRAKKRRT
jgi:hypothetical protein